MASGLISGNTQICFVLGDPISHVRTPQALNRLFAENRVDATMAPLHVLPDDLGSALSFIRCARNVRGAVVTIPHKIAASQLCDELSERAAEARAVNVIRKTDDGRLAGDLLDGVGFVAGLTSRGVSLKGGRVFLQGAGGAGRAIAFALAAAGVDRLQIRNRHQGRAVELADRLRAKFPGLTATVSAEDPADVDVAINASSLGLRPKDPAPFGVGRLASSALVADVIMLPEETDLLRSARARGCRVQPGRAMLDGQLVPIAEFLGLAGGAGQSQE